MSKKKKKNDKLVKKLISYKYESINHIENAREELCKVLSRRFTTLRNMVLNTVLLPEDDINQAIHVINMVELDMTGLIDRRAQLAQMRIRHYVDKAIKKPSKLTGEKMKIACKLINTNRNKFTSSLEYFSSFNNFRTNFIHHANDNIKAYQNTVDLIKTF